MITWLTTAWAVAMAHWYLGGAAIAGGIMAAAGLDWWVHRGR